MICSNCGFQNAAGDQFCGSCGQPLAAGPPAAPAGQSATTGTTNYAPDVICWKCGRRNPPGRSFCMQCGERLEAAGATGAGGGAVSGGGVRTTASPAGAGGGMLAGRGRLVGIVAALILVLLVGLVAAAALLNRPGQPGVAALIESPSPSPRASGALTPTPGATLASALPSGASPSASAGVVLTPTPPPTPTKAPTAPPTSKPTPLPTPVTCANYTGPTKSLVLHPANQHTIPAKKDWCVVSVTFTNDSPVGEPGTFKLYLMNSAVFTDLNNYTYGWLEADLVADFQDSNTYQPKVTYPKSYMKGSLYGSTVISFLVPYCAGTTCDGSIQIDYNPIPAQSH
jgi:hypothetical protein